MRYAGRVTENFPVATAGASMLPAMGALLRRIHEDMSRAAVVFRACGLGAVTTGRQPLWFQQVLVPQLVLLVQPGRT